MKVIIAVWSFLLVYVLFVGCSKVIPEPQNSSESYIRLVHSTDCFYKNRVGHNRKIFFDNTEFSWLLKWYQTNWITSCSVNYYRNKLCLVDVNNSGFFTHMAVKGRAPLYPLDKKLEYEILPASKLIKVPEIYYDSNLKIGLTIIYRPKLNTINISEIGDTMFTKSNKFLLKTQRVFLLEEAKGYAKNKKFKILNREKSILLDWNNKGFKTKCFDKEGICLVDIDNDGYFDHSAVPKRDYLYPLFSKVKYELIQDSKTIDNSFKYIVLYQGKVGNKIKISFREFKNNMARAAFTQDIEYELQEDGTAIIGFKGLRIKVIHVTNTSIKYKILKDYNYL